LNFINRFVNYAQISNFIKIHPVRAELFHADGRMDEGTNIRKLIVAFRNFAYAPDIGNPLKGMEK